MQKLKCIRFIWLKTRSKFLIATDKLHVIEGRVVSIALRGFHFGLNATNARIASIAPIAPIAPIRSGAEQDFSRVAFEIDIIGCCVVTIALRAFHSKLETNQAPTIKTCDTTMPVSPSKENQFILVAMSDVICVHGSQNTTEHLHYYGVF
jgi:hypothetical protein